MGIASVGLYVCTYQFDSDPDTMLIFTWRWQYCTMYIAYFSNFTKAYTVQRFECYKTVSFNRLYNTIKINILFIRILIRIYFLLCRSGSGHTFDTYPDNLYQINLLEWVWVEHRLLFITRRWKQGSNLSHNVLYLVSTASTLYLVSTAIILYLVSTASMLYLFSTTSMLHLVSTASILYLVSTTCMLYLVSIASMLYLVSTASMLYLVSTASMLYLVSTASMC